MLFIEWAKNIYFYVLQIVVDFNDKGHCPERLILPTVKSLINNIRLYAWDLITCSYMKEHVSDHNIYFRVWVTN